VENAVETESASARVVLGNGAVLFFAGPDNPCNYMKISYLFLIKVNDATFFAPWAATPCI
jgi:hypothetical protein